MTTLIPKYDQGSTGAINRAINLKLSEIVSVKDFGAIGDGITDDTAAIQKCIAAVQAELMSGNSGIYGNGNYVGTAPTVYFPFGVYKISSSLTIDNAQQVNYMKFVGENSIIVISSSVTAFGGIGFDVDFESLIFREGARAISIKTNNTNTAVININRCEFYEQTTAQIAIDSNSPSSIVNINQCKFISNTATGWVGYWNSNCYVNLIDSWVQTNAPIAFFNSANFTIIRMVGVPGSNQVITNGAWIQNNLNGSIRVTESRFGGESAGAPIVFNYNDLQSNNSNHVGIGNFIIIENCETYVGAASRTDAAIIVAKVGLTSLMRITGCSGMASNGNAYIIDGTSGGLASWFSTFKSGSFTQLTLECHTNNFVQQSLGGTAALTALLLPYTLYEQCNESLGNNYFIPTISTAVLEGTNYPQTSTSSTTSIIDTTIFYNTAQIGYSNASIYDVHITGCPNNTGSSSYASPLVGILLIQTGYSSGVKQFIQFNTLYNPSNTGTTNFTVSAVFWDGSSETSSVSDGTTTTNVRLKVAGFSGVVGNGLVCRITKRL
jgi:hypothetical protein